MNKTEFLSALGNRLSGLPKEDIDRSIDYYTEMIDDRTEDGLSEEDAVAALGNIDEIAAQIVSETSLPKLVKTKIKPKRALSTWEIILLILGAPLWLPLIITIFSIVLAAYIVIWAAIVALYSADLTLAVSSLAGLFSAGIQLLNGSLSLSAIYLGAGLFLAGLSLFMFLGCNSATKVLLLLSKKIILGIKYMFIGRRTSK